jgi:hypothetical protein
MIALPVELNSEQRYELVRGFMHQLGHGRIAWCAAHHDSGEDVHNPHAHILFKDADIDTGRTRTVGFSPTERPPATSCGKGFPEESSRSANRSPSWQYFGAS